MRLQGHRGRARARRAVNAQANEKAWTQCCVCQQQWGSELLVCLARECHKLCEEHTAPDDTHDGGARAAVHFDDLIAAMRITDALAQTKRLDEALVLGTKTVDLCRVAVEEVALVATETREENFAKRLAAEGAQRSVEKLCAGALRSLSDVYWLMDNAAASVPLQVDALSHLRRSLDTGSSEDNITLCSELSNLAVTHASMDNLPAALPLFAEAASLSKKVRGSEHQLTKNAKENFDQCLRLMPPSGRMTAAYPELPGQDDTTNGTGDRTGTSVFFDIAASCFALVDGVSGLDTSGLIVGDLVQVGLTATNSCPFDCAGCSGCGERAEQFWNKITSIEGETISAEVDNCLGLFNISIGDTIQFQRSNILVVNTSKNPAREKKYEKVTKETQLRFPVGQLVQCCTDQGGEFPYEPGIIVDTFYTERSWPEGDMAAYQVQMDDGRLIWAPYDQDGCIKALVVTEEEKAEKIKAMHKAKEDAEAKAQQEEMILATLIKVLGGGDSAWFEQYVSDAKNVAGLAIAGAERAWFQQFINADDQTLEICVAMNSSKLDRELGNELMNELMNDFIHDVIARRARYPVEQNIAA